MGCVRETPQIKNRSQHGMCKRNSPQKSKACMGWVRETRMCWTHLQMFSVSTVLGQGEKAFDVEKSWGAGAKLTESRPPPHWTGRGQLNEGIMFGELRCAFHHFPPPPPPFFFFFFRSVHDWMGMDEWVNVSECLQNANLVRRLWTVEKDV